MHPGKLDSDQQSPLAYTPDEIMVVCISRQVRNGEIVAQGTPEEIEAVKASPTGHFLHMKSISIVQTTRFIG